MADLWAARNVDGNEWRYNRKKTASRRADNAEVRVLLSEPFTSLLRQAGRQSGGEWLAPVLRRWARPSNATEVSNRGLREWADREGVEPFTIYAARHTFASLARSLGVEKATIDEALGHVGEFRVTDIYAERNWALAWEASEKVLALFDWSPIMRADDPQDA